MDVCGQSCSNHHPPSKPLEWEADLDMRLSYRICMPTLCFNAEMPGIPPVMYMPLSSISNFDDCPALFYNEDINYKNLQNGNWFK